MASVTTTVLANGGLVASVLSDLVMEQLYDPTDLTALMSRMIGSRISGGGGSPSGW